MTSTILTMDEVTSDTIGGSMVILFFIALVVAITVARMYRIREQEKTRRIISGQVEDTTEYAENPKVYQRPDIDRTSVYHE